jgi:hypothetical protein
MGGPRNQRTAGGGVLQPQGVIHAGDAAPGALPPLSPGPRRGGGFFMAAVEDDENRRTIGSCWATAWPR